MSEVKVLKRSAILMLIVVLAVLLSIVTATYAWFTFTASARVEPMSGTISGGGVELLISNSSNGPFDRTCDLILDSDAEALLPVTTANLSKFYVPTAQTPEGIPTDYRELSDTGNYLLNGRVYLKSEGAPCRVYLHSDELFFGEDIQAIASMRLGLQLKTQSGTETYIFRLDDFANTSTALAQTTVEREGTVYGGSYVNDPAENLDTYSANGGEGSLVVGQRNLCVLQANEVAEVEYWLYLEGCDKNCYNPVQSDDLSLRLGFAGYAL